MNRHLSVLALAARQTIGKVMALLAVMAAAETALFAWAMSRGLTRAIMDDKTCPAPVEDLFDFGRISWVYWIALAMIFALLLLNGMELRGGKKGYTLRRLRISEEAAVLWAGGYNALCFLALWAVQAALALGFCLWYAGTLDPAYASGQSAFLAFYRSGFLHGLLPLADVSRWVRALACTAALGLTTAMFGYYQRNRSKSIVALVVLTLSLMSYGTAPGAAGLDWGMVTLFALISGWQLLMLRRAWKEGGVDDEDWK